MEPTNGDLGNDPTQKTRIGDPKIDSLGTAPQWLQVFILPADESCPRALYLPTIDTSTEPPLPTDSREQRPQAPTNDSELWMAAFQAASARAECRPDIRILPDPRTGGYWSDESWKKRAVLKADFWHVLFTQRRGDLPLNLWTGGLFFGHVFIVKAPSTVDSDGHQAYRSIFPDAATPDQEMYLLNLFVNGIIRGLIQGTGRVHLGL